jgi:mono/diheme cytochrome c family protein
MKRTILLVMVLAFSSSGGQVCAQGAGDRQEGLRLAQDVCSECHAILRAQSRSPNSRSPTFYELATAPGMTTPALMVALTTPHAGIAYILSLR